MFILFQVPLINKNGTKSMHCIIRGKFVISPCRKSALFWIHAVILLFHAEILPCGPPLLPHSCAEPFLGVVQKYSFLGDIYTSGHGSRKGKFSERRMLKLTLRMPLNSGAGQRNTCAQCPVELHHRLFNTFLQFSDPNTSYCMILWF